MALNGSDLDRARGMGQLYIPIWEYVKLHIRSQGDHGFDAGYFAWQSGLVPPFFRRKST